MSSIKARLALAFCLGGLYLQAQQITGTWNTCGITDLDARRITLVRTGKTCRSCRSSKWDFSSRQQRADTIRALVITIHNDECDGSAYHTEMTLYTWAQKGRDLWLNEAKDHIGHWFRIASCTNEKLVLRRRKSPASKSSMKPS